MSAAPAPRYLAAGESALVVEFGAKIDPAIHHRVLALDAALSKANIGGVIETVPTYRSLMIHFDPRRWPMEELVAAIARLEEAPRLALELRRRWHIPACYEPPFAEDIDLVASALGLSAARVAELHATARYRVYMYGFAPGFLFLGGLPQALNFPRRPMPRAPVPAGALLIAGGQALIASCPMPTGWYMLGRTPVKMFAPRRDPIFLMGIGDEVCFEQIGGSAFRELTEAAEAGDYYPRCECVDDRA